MQQTGKNSCVLILYLPLVVDVLCARNKKNVMKVKQHNLKKVNYRHCNIKKNIWKKKIFTLTDFSRYFRGWKKNRKQEVSGNLYHVDFKLVTFRFAQIKLRNKRTDKNFQEILDFILTFCGKGLGFYKWKEYEWGEIK